MISWRLTASESDIVQAALKKYSRDLRRTEDKMALGVADLADQLHADLRVRTERERAPPAVDAHLEAAYDERNGDGVNASGSE